MPLGSLPTGAEVIGKLWWREAAGVHGVLPRCCPIVQRAERETQYFWNPHKCHEVCGKWKGCHSLNTITSVTRTIISTCTWLLGNNHSFFIPHYGFRTVFQPLRQAKWHGWNIHSLPWSSRLYTGYTRGKTQIQCDPHWGQWHRSKPLSKIFAGWNMCIDLLDLGMGVEPFGSHKCW